MTLAYIGIGSNIEPGRNIPAAVRMRAWEIRGLELSTVYRTAPAGSVPSPAFCNGVARGETPLEEFTR